MTGPTAAIGEAWQCSTIYREEGLNITPVKFGEVTDLLLERPNLNSTHLFRADILYDSAGVLKTTIEKEEEHGIASHDQRNEPSKCASLVTFESNILPVPPVFPAYRLERTVIRRLIPRKPQLDRALQQSCYIYVASADDSVVQDLTRLVVYIPNLDSSEDMPWYHPQVKGMAYMYEQRGDQAALSIQYLPYPGTPSPVPARLHRTLLSLLNTYIRLTKTAERPGDGGADGQLVERLTESHITARAITPAAIRDAILPQHLVQDTYTLLKQRYATDLIKRWVEKTEPSKHVFEDLSIAAFLIELWRQMYKDCEFPGFIDMACGNGVLVYVLIKEGFAGCGFDARRRKTWEILGIDEFLTEKLCIPKPFLDALHLDEDNALTDLTVHNGIIEPHKFIISNHADELTPWTPLLAALSSPACPLPFLAIPCCSHALSGAKHRYSLKDLHIPHSSPESVDKQTEGDSQQPASGDLKALRTSRVKPANHADDKSTYGCLTRKIVALADEVGYAAEMTLMRIPSTRNIGIVGGRHRGVTKHREDVTGQTQALSFCEEDQDSDRVRSRIGVLLERECANAGGVEAAARAWIERAQKLHAGKGRGKVNYGGRFEHG